MESLQVDFFVKNLVDRSRPWRLMFLDVPVWPASRVLGCSCVSPRANSRITSTRVSRTLKPPLLTPSVVFTLSILLYFKTQGLLLSPSPSVSFSSSSLPTSMVMSSLEGRMKSLNTVESPTSPCCLRLVLPSVSFTSEFRSLSGINLPIGMPIRVTVLRMRSTSLP
jgi:hypothetical protein